MKKIQLAIMAVAVGLAMQSQASLYDITFSGSGYSANGQIDVSGGLATSGYLTVTVGNDLGTYDLVTGGSSIRITDGTDLIYDNLVNPGNNPFLDINGLAFVSAAVDIHGHPLVGFNLWGNGTDNYSLFDVSPGVYNTANGAATITAVPEATTMIAGALLLLPFGASTLRILR